MLKAMRPVRAGRFGTAVLVAAATLSAGCYEHVVESSGFGSSRHDIEPVYRSETFLDKGFDKVFGPQQPTNPPSWRAMPDSDVKTTTIVERRPPQ